MNSCFLLIYVKSIWCYLKTRYTSFSVIFIQWETIVFFFINKHLFCWLLITGLELAFTLWTYYKNMVLFPRCVATSVNPTRSKKRILYVDSERNVFRTADRALQLGLLFSLLSIFMTRNYSLPVCLWIFQVVERMVFVGNTQIHLSIRHKD